MFLEEQRILLCGIDHGFSTMKTAHFVFENGVKELGGEASLTTNTMLLHGRYFKVGEGRLPLKDTKVEDEDYYLLTLAAIAKEMDYYGLGDAEVCIAAGLPFTRFGQEKAEFKEYLNPGSTNFQYNGKEYHIICRDVFLYPQCYAAIADRLGKLPAELLIVDIGSKTIDIIHTRKHVPVESDCIIIPSALIQCMANINNVVYRKTNRTLTEEQMKRFKRLDTISEDFSRENLDAAFKYGEPGLVSPIVHTMSLPVMRKAILTPYQKKCYTRMYRLRLAEKKRFTYGSAYLYEQIRKMHELQEEYLLVVNYDVKSFGDLYRLKLRLQNVDEELCKAQKELYRDRASQKRSCKTTEDMAFFETFEDDYRDKLEQIKMQKKDNHKKLKAVERCLERDGSLLEAELELRIPVDELGDITEMYKVEVPENPYRVQEDVVVVEPIIEPIAEIVVGNGLVADVGADAETAVTHVGAESETVVVDDVTAPGADIDQTESVVSGQENDEVRKSGETMRLPSDKADYMRMSVAEKVCCYPFDDEVTDAAFEMVRAYFEKIGMDTSFHSVYEESKLLMDYYEKQKAEKFIGERVEQAIKTMELLGIDAGRMADYAADVLVEAFCFGDMEYFAGMKLFNRVIDRLGVDMDQQSRYEVFDRIYEEEMQEKKFEQARNSL